MPRLSLALDASQICTYLECPEMWNLQYNHCLRPAGLKKAALDKGTAIHGLTDIYYKLRGLDPTTDYQLHAKAAIDLYKNNKVITGLGLDSELEEFLLMRFLQYTYYYGSSKNDFLPITYNKRLGVELGFSEILLDTPEYLFIIEGRLDLITKISGKILWVDHKTQERISHLYTKKGQFLTYGLATGLPGQVNYIGLQKEINKDTFRRSEVISFSDYTLNLWKNQIIEEAFIPIVKTISNNREFKLNLNACAGAFESNPCMFTKICETADPTMRESIKKFAYVQVEPWTPWRS